MNYLQICQRVFIEGGISGQITDVQNQSGEPARIAAWVASAYQELCTEDPTRWWFLRDRVSIQLPTVAKSEYSLADLGLTDLYAFDTNTFRVSVNANFSDETFLIGKRWPEFRDLWRFSTRRDTISRPLDVSVTPTRGLAFGPLPDQLYHVQFEYVKIAPALVKNDDVPVIPDEYQMAIVWLALKHYGMFESAPEVVMRAEFNYNEMVTRMYITQSDEVVVGPPLC